MAQLREIELQIIERFEHIADAFGIRGLKARLLSILITAAGEPRSLTELTELSQFSKAQVSRSMKELLLETPMIKMVKRPQDRERYYVIHYDIMDFISGFIAKTIYEEASPTIKITEEAIAQLKRLIKSTKNKTTRAEAERLLHKIMDINQQYRKYYWVSTQLLPYLNELSQKWDREHSTEE